MQTCTLWGRVAEVPDEEKDWQSDSLYINLLFIKKLVAHKTTNLNKLNQRATCLQISQRGGRVEHWVEQN